MHYDDRDQQLPALPTACDNYKVTDVQGHYCTVPNAHSASRYDTHLRKPNRRQPSTTYLQRPSELVTRQAMVPRGPASNPTALKRPLTLIVESPGGIATNSRYNVSACGSSKTEVGSPLKRTCLIQPGTASDAGVGVSQLSTFSVPPLPSYHPPSLITLLPQQAVQSLQHKSLQHMLPNSLTHSLATGSKAVRDQSRTTWTPAQPFGIDSSCYSASCSPSPLPGTSSTISQPAAPASSGPQPYYMHPAYDTGCASGLPPHYNQPVAKPVPGRYARQSSSNRCLPAPVQLCVADAPSDEASGSSHTPCTLGDGLAGCSTLQQSMQYPAKLCVKPETFGNQVITSWQTVTASQRGAQTLCSQDSQQPEREACSQSAATPLLTVQQSKNALEVQQINQSILSPEGKWPVPVVTGVYPQLWQQGTTWKGHHGLLDYE